MSQITDNERLMCNDSALRCFATAYIFERRAAPLRMVTKLMAFLSLAGPLSVGLLVFLLNAESPWLPVAALLAIILASALSVVSLWALAAGWQDNLGYFSDSKADNYLLASRYRDLANDTSRSPTRWRNEVASLDIRGEYRTQTDLHYDISDDEKRMGMCAALREYQRPCAGCKQTPVAIKPSNCGVCGMFKTRRFKWLA